MICDRKLVRLCADRELSGLLRYRPCTAAATLPAATIDEGLAMKLTSGGRQREG